jgi:adenosine deaminase
MVRSNGPRVGIAAAGDLTLSPTAPDANQGFDSIPKVDLHRHLEGSLRLATLVELARSEKLDLPQDEAGLRPLVQIVPQDPRRWSAFLSKFETVRKFFLSPDIVRRTVREAIEDAAAENVRYLELHFTPAALRRVRDFPLPDLFDWVVQESRAAAFRTGIRVGLVVSVNRHEPLDLAGQVARLAVERARKEIVGLDLAGNEAEFPADPFRGLFAEAAQAGLGVSVHAGEWDGAASVRYAMEVMGADRIVHGVRVMDDPSLVALAKERRTVFEVCLSSNLHSGVVQRIEDHPLPRMLGAGLQVTLNSDDPCLLNMHLSDDFRLAVERLGLSRESLKGLTLAAAQAAFLPAKDKRELEAELEAALFPAA